MSESLIFAHFLFFGEQCEWIAHFAQIKWAMWANCSDCSPKMSGGSESLRSLRGNEWSWVNRSGRSPKMGEWVNHSHFWANRSFAHFWTKNERFARKTNERIPSPAILYSNWDVWKGILSIYYEIFLFRLIRIRIQQKMNTNPSPVLNPAFFFSRPEMVNFVWKF